MKTMTCKNLGGACDLEFKGETFEDMAQQSQKHGMEMAAANDEAHLEVMAKMKEMMGDTEAMNAWMEEKKREFDALPEDE